MRLNEKLPKNTSPKEYQYGWEKKSQNPPKISLSPSSAGAKTFPWSVNPLSSVNHHQGSVNCFNTAATSISSGASSMLPTGMTAPLSGGGSPAGR